MVQTSPHHDAYTVRLGVKIKDTVVCTSSIFGENV